MRLLVFRAVHAKTVAYSALYCAKNECQFYCNVFFLALMSSSTSHLKCWLSLWLTSPVAWSTSAARTSFTETLLLATACKLCFRIFTLLVPLCVFTWSFPFSFHRAILKNIFWNTLQQIMPTFRRISEAWHCKKILIFQVSTAVK